MDISKEKPEWIYTTMYRIRRFEETMLEQTFKGNAMGVTHPSDGQEAPPTGICAHLTDKDWIGSTHRGHGHCIAKGLETDKMMAEIMGKATGQCGGKGGSMHIADFSVGMLGANGIAGAGMPIATGAALAAQMDGNGGVAACFFGDGASNAGTFHTSLNLASVWKLPVIFVCENNGWAVSVPASYGLSVEDVAVRGSSYNIPGVTVDGIDVLAVYEATQEAVRRARSGEGPTLLECKTHRWRIHSEQRGNPEDPRPQEAKDQGPQHDPIAEFARRLTEQGVMSQALLQQIHQEVEDAVGEAIEFAKNSPFPKPEDALSDVFAP
mgnify:CR=1 FL=1